MQRETYTGHRERKGEGGEGRLFTMNSSCGICMIVTEHILLGTATITFCVRIHKTLLRVSRDMSISDGDMSGFR